MKIKKYNIFAIVTLFMSCISSTYMFAACQLDQQFITVFVHGSKLTPGSISKKYLFRMPGIHHINDYAPFYNCRQVAELLVQADPENYTLKHYHYFGWSGKLDFNERKKTANDLYIQLEKLYYDYEQTYGKTPKIRIITHSHGGNVFLNLARIIPKNSPIFIDEAIILACPVQEKTKHLLANPRFKKVYAFYSGNDMFQVLDPQGWYKKGKSKKLFSERTFPKSSNLRQARIKLQGRHPMHIDFFLPKFMANLPAACRKLDEMYEMTPSQKACRNKQLNIYYKRTPPVIFTSLLP